MDVFLNGRFVPEEQAAISIFDRGFLYGDGLFETLRLQAGIPFRWETHLGRLQAGARALDLPLQDSGQTLERLARELARRNQRPDALLRITLSRGPGPRGYSTKETGPPTLLLTQHPFDRAGAEEPLSWRLQTVSVRLPLRNPLGSVKTANKLPQILARQEAERQGADDALLLNDQGSLVEASSANLFLIMDGAMATPPLDSGALPGVTREVIRELEGEVGLHWTEQTLVPADLSRAQGGFLTLSSHGVIEIAEVDGVPLNRTEKVGQLFRALEGRVTRECGAAVSR